MGGSSAPLQSPTQNASQGQTNLSSLTQAQNDLTSNPATASIVQQFQSGSMNLNDALAALSNSASSTGTPATPATPGSGPTISESGISAQVPSSDATPGTPGTPSDSAESLQIAFMSDPALAQEIATQQAMSSPALAGLFGSGGLQSQAEQNYSNYGNQYQNATSNYNNDYSSFVNGTSPLYSMNNQDLAAYGQAAGNIARMSGNTDQSLSQQLANRGLGAAPSGSAQQGFSTVYGNQMEQLAGLQTNIAQNRINTANSMLQTAMQGDVNQQQLAQSGQANSGALASNLGALGENAISNAASTNYNAINQYANINGQQAGIQQQNQALQQNIANEAFAQQQQTSLGSMLGGALAGAVGTGVGALTGGLGTNAAGSLIAPATQNINITGGGGTAGGVPTLGNYFNGTNPYSLQNSP